MALKFSDLKKGKGKFGDLIDAVQKEAKGGGGGFQEDTRLWKLEGDNAGNGFAVIRFLPAPQGEDHPWVRVYSHGFKGPTGKWYIENNLSTIGQDDPVSEYNSMLWARGTEEAKDQARDQARRTNFYSNILVVNDPKHPENNGKVFLFRYGKKIFEKIKDAMNPAFEDETPINPFDFWEGANFKFKMRKVEGYANYDKSEFEEASPISEDDDAIEQIWKQEHSLQEFLSPKEFKSYGQLKAKFEAVMGLAGGKPSLDREDREESVQKTVERSPAKADAVDVPWKEETAAADDDDDLAFFKNLANTA